MPVPAKVALEPNKPLPTKLKMASRRAIGGADPDPTKSTAASWVAGRLRLDRWKAGRQSAEHRNFPEEMPTAVTVNGVEYAVMLTSPSDFTDFAFGFLLSERLIGAGAEVESVNVRFRPEGICVDVRLLGAPTRHAAGRNLVGISGCGLCGVQSLDEANKPMSWVRSGPRISGDAIIRAFAGLPGLQRFNQVAGAMHAAGYALADGRLICVREDVGRHNALDKLIGALMRRGTNPAEGFVVMSSRCSYELVQKVSVFGIPILATVSAPTAMAVRLAREANVTLVNQVRSDSFSILAGAERITDSEEAADG